MMHVEGCFFLFRGERENWFCLGEEGLVFKEIGSVDVNEILIFVVFVKNEQFYIRNGMSYLLRAVYNFIFKRKFHHFPVGKAMVFIM